MFHRPSLPPSLQSREEYMVHSLLPTQNLTLTLAAHECLGREQSRTILSDLLREVLKIPGIVQLACAAPGEAPPLSARARERVVARMQVRRREHWHVIR